MKIVIFGSNGKTGKLLVEQALALGYTVYAYIRSAGSLNIDHPNLKIIVGNLTEILKIKDIIMKTDACLSALGGKSLNHHDIEIRNGIENIISIMEEVGKHRFIYLSSLGAGDSRIMIPQPFRFFLINILLRIPIADHEVNEKNIIDSKLDWTIVRPGGLNDGIQTTTLNHGTEIIKVRGNPGISRANVASFMLKQIKELTYIKKLVWIYE